MQKTIFSQISTLKNSEFERFSKYVSSPFFNTRNDVIKFVNYLAKKIPLIAGTNISYEEIYREIYGGANFSRQVVKNLLSRTLAMLDGFFIQLSLEGDKDMQVTALTKELQKRKLNRKAEKILNERILDLKKSSEYTLEYYKKISELKELKHGNLSESDSKQRIISDGERFSAAMKSFLVSLLRIANDYEVYSFVENAPQRNEYIENITKIIDIEQALELIKENEPDEYALIACYYFGLLSKTNDPQNIYREKLKEFSFKNIEHFRHNDNIEFWQMIFSSYIFSKAQKGPVDVQTLHSINKMYVEKNVANKDEKGYIDENNYHNIIMQSIAANDLEWTESFINKYKDELNPETRENTYNFLMGYFMLNKGEYSRVIPYLSKVRSGDIPVQLTIRWMYIRAYYELGHYFEAESTIHAFKNFISTSGRVTKESRSTYPASLGFIDAVVKSRLSGKKLDEEKYLKAKNSSFIAKKWVIEKMEELLNI